MASCDFKLYGLNENENNPTYMGFAPTSKYIFTFESVFALLFNIALIISFRYDAIKKKEKQATLNKLLMLLSIIEMCLSIMWLVNQILFNGEVKDFINKKCQDCRIFGAVWIFLYNFEWLFLAYFLKQFHLVLTNAFGTTNFRKQFLLAFIGIFSLSATDAILGYFSFLSGLSPMMTCFANIHIYSSEGNKFFSIIKLLIFLTVPFGTISYGVYKGITTYKKIKTNCDQKEILTLFLKYSMYLGAYLILSLFLILVYLVESIIYISNNQIGNNKTFRYYAYFMSLLNCGTPFITGILKLILSSEAKKFLCYFCLKNHVSSQEIIDNSKISTTLLPTKTFTFAVWEKAQLESFISNVYISASYCIAKTDKTVRNFTDLKKKDAMHSEKYEITLDKISKEGYEKMLNDNFIQNNLKKSVKCEEHAPKIFSYLRCLDDIDPNDMINSLLPTMNTEGITKETGGKGGGLFLHSYDRRFILKTLTKEELNLLKEKFIYEFAEHLTKNPDSIICRIYGAFSIKAGNENNTFFIMRNVFGIFKSIKVHYDLKGSKLNREVGFQEDAIKKNNSLEGKDIDFDKNELGGLMLPINYAKKLNRIANTDSTFFAELGIMDYSLFVVKVGVTLEEINFLFGEGTVQKMINEYCGITDCIKRGEMYDPPEESDISNEVLLGNNTNMENINLKKESVQPLMKYMFPRLDSSNIFIVTIIDFFQLYTFKKKLETEFKKIKAKSEDISSMEPKGYQSRFMDLVNNLTNTIKIISQINSH